MAKNMKKRILSALLVIVLMFTTVDVNVLAIDISKTQFAVGKDTQYDFEEETNIFSEKFEEDKSSTQMVTEEGMIQESYVEEQTGEIVDESEIEENNSSDAIDEMISEYDSTVFPETSGEEISNLEEKCEESVTVDLMTQNTESELNLEFEENNIQIEKNSDEILNWCDMAADGFAGGSGTEDDPYLIENAEQLARMANSSGWNYKLISDIYLNNSLEDIDYRWVVHRAFWGSLDGSGYTIYNMYIEDTYDYRGSYGLFAEVRGCIKNLCIQNVRVDAGWGIVGLLAYTNNGMIDNCSIEGDIIISSHFGINGGSKGIGLLVNTNEGTINNSKIKGTVNLLCDFQQDEFTSESKRNIELGGIAYKNNNSINNCSMEADISGISLEDEENNKDNIVGIGYFNFGLIQNCINKGNIKIGNGDASGIAYESFGEIENCINYGTISSNGDICGIVYSYHGDRLIKCSNEGALNGKNVYGIAKRVTALLIENCTNSSNMKCYASSEHHTGELSGLFGEVSILQGDICTIKNCINYGNLEGTYVYGIVETIETSAESKCNVENCGNEGDLFGQTNALGVIGTTSKSVLYDIAGEINLRNCFNKGRVTAEDIAAGLVGFSSYPINIIDCYNSGNICSENAAAGIICNFLCDGEIIKTYNIGEVQSSNLAGGIIATIKYDNNSILQCYNAGKIIVGNKNSSYIEAGGIVGSIDLWNDDQKTVQIENCFNCGQIDVKFNNNYPCVGGLVGSTTVGTAAIVDIINCYNIGIIPQMEGMANVIGGDSGGGKINIENVYYLKNGLPEMGNDWCEVDLSACYECTEEQMQDISTYKEWDFTQIWTKGNDDYLFPMLQGVGNVIGGDTPPDENISGECGDNLIWNLHYNGEYDTLTISGTGDMYDYAIENEKSTAPWTEHIKSKTVILNIEEGVASIGKNAFYGMSSFSGNLKIPKSIITIGEKAFYDCIGFTDIYILDTLIEINENPFCCFNMETSIFENLELTFHCIKDSYAYNWALENGFKVVEWDGVTIGGDTPPNQDNSGKCGDNLTWKLEEGKEYYTLTISGTGDMYDYAVENGESTAPWAEHIKSKTVSLNIEESVTSIGKNAFYGASSFRGNIKIPKSVMTIGADAFWGCTGFTDIYLLDTVTEIKGNPFRHFNALVATFTNMQLMFHCIKGSYAYNWAKNNKFVVEEWDGSTIDIKKGDIKINGRGYAYATFKLIDNNGIVQKNAKIKYSFGGKSYIATSDSDGIVQIKSEELSAKKPISKLIKTTEIILDPNGKNEKLNYRVVMDVEVTPFTYTQTWELGATGSGKVGLAEALGIELGTAELQAALGEANIVASQKGTISIKQEIVGDTKNIELTQNLNSKIGLNNSIGPEAKAKAINNEFTVKPLSISGEGNIGYGSSIGLKIDNYNPRNFNQNLDIGKFILAMSAHQTGSAFWIKVVDTMGLDVYNVSNVSVGLMGKAGVNVGSIKYGDKDLGTLANLEGSISCTYIDGKDETTEKLFKETKTVSSIKGGWMNTGPEKRTRVLSSNTKAGYGAKIFKDYNNNLKKLMISVDTAQTAGTLFKDTTQTQKLSVEFDAIEAKNILNNVNVLRDWCMGLKSFILDGAEAFQQVEEVGANGKYTCSTTSTMGSEYTFGIGVTAGVKIGLKLGLEGAYDLGYSTESGDYENGSIIKTGETSNVSDLLSQTSVSDVADFFADPVDIALNSAKDFISDVWDDFKNGVQNAFATVESAIDGALDEIGNWAVHIISLSPIKNQTFTSYSVMVIQPTAEGEENEKVVYTVGDAYYVYVTNEKEEQVDDFTEHPLNLTLEYTDDMLLAARISKENVNNISIYMHSEELGGYVCIGGKVDTDNNSVTVEITKSGEYILATDTTAPIVTAITVSEGTNKPLIIIDFDEQSGFKEFSLKLDDMEVITTDNWKSYYNYAYHRISYQVENELTNGAHTVSVYAMDSAGNSMPEPVIFEFYIGNVYKVIFMADDSSEPIAVINAAEGTNVTLPEVPLRKGYTFSGWFTEQDGRGEKFTDTTPVTMNITLYAYWIKNEIDYGDILPEDVPVDGMIPTGLWIAGATDQIYTGMSIKPEVRVYDNNILLTEKIDYTIAYKNNKKVGDAVVIVTGKGNYSGKETATFKILPVDLSENESEVYAMEFYVKTSKKVQKPIPILYYMGSKLKHKTDFTIKYSNASGIYPLIGEHSVIITGKGNYTGTRQIPLMAVEKIVKKTPISISNAKINNFEKTVDYTGKRITQKCTLSIKNSDGSEKQLIEGMDYAVGYTNNIKAGTATIIFYGKNGYAGKLKKTYKIMAYDIVKDKESKLRFEKNILSVYTKGGSKPKPVITYDNQQLQEGIDYILNYKNNNAVGNSKAPIIVVKGKGNFTGRMEIPFTIKTQDLNNMTLVSCDKIYKNKANIYKITPKLMDVNGKMLTVGKDYDKNSIIYTYDENVVLENGVSKKSGAIVENTDIIPADTQIRITLNNGSGNNYKGTFSGTYRIVKADIKSAKVTIPSQSYTGNEIILDKSQIKVKLSQDILKPDDFEIVGYTNNIKKGTATVTIKGIGNYGGTKNIKFRIKAKGFSWWWKK